MSQTRPYPILAEFEADDVELAGQLLGMRQNPDASLRHRVQSIPQQPERGIRFAPHLAWGSLVMVVLVVLLFASPTAQAMLGQVEKVIGRIHLTMIDVLPARPNPIVIESTPISLAEAQTTVPFEFAMPTYIPAGLTNDTEVFITELQAPIVKIRWRDTAGGFIQLSAHTANGENNLTQNLIGSESSDTILINGQAAVIIYGGWDEASRTWSHQQQVRTLIWELDGIQYNLLSYSHIVSLTELTAMAQSVR